MKSLVWLLVLGIAAGFVYWIWIALKRMEARRRTSEERFATFLAQNANAGPPKLEPAAKPPPAIHSAANLEPQWLLLEAATKAGAAGEPALSIQLYARLIARYPQSPLVEQARAAVEQQKSKLARP